MTVATILSTPGLSQADARAHAAERIAKQNILLVWVVTSTRKEGRRTVTSTEAVLEFATAKRKAAMNLQCLGYLTSDVTPLHVYTHDYPTA